MALTQIIGEGLQSTLAIGSEGGAVTTSVQQGLAKAWHQFNGTGTVATLDSFNISSLTDNAAGNYSSSYTNSMGNQYYSTSGSCVGSSSSNFWSFITSNGSTEDIGTASVRFQIIHYEGTSNDQIRANVNIHGDLA
jgi:hypothetical protein